MSLINAKAARERTVCTLLRFDKLVDKYNIQDNITSAADFGKYATKFTIDKCDFYQFGELLSQHGYRCELMDKIPDPENPRVSVLVEW